MRLIPQILAILLAITSIAVPCVAKTQISDVAPTSAITVVSGEVGGELEKSACQGSCIKAIVSRQDDLDHPTTAPEFNNDLFAGNLQQSGHTVVNPVSLSKPPNAVCTNPVDLNVLCRQLN